MIGEQDNKVQGVEEKKSYFLDSRHLITNQLCTAFILSKNSQLRDLFQPITDGSGETEDFNKEQGKDLQNSTIVQSHLLLKFFLIIFGLFAGYLIAFVVDSRVLRLRR